MARSKANKAMVKAKKSHGHRGKKRAYKSLSNLGKLQVKRGRRG